jgi:hypothetical protein|tara:strand:+ start:774 stop:917 length:144 start_codon:yes stop_codon:yes gene_type:complete
MLKFIVLSVLLNTGEIIALPPEEPKTEAGRRRNKSGRGKRRGGGGLR